MADKINEITNSVYMVLMSRVAVILLCGISAWIGFLLYQMSTNVTTVLATLSQHERRIDTIEEAIFIGEANAREDRRRDRTPTQ